MTAIAAPRAARWLALCFTLGWSALACGTESPAAAAGGTMAAPGAAGSGGSLANGPAGASGANTLGGGGASQTVAGTAGSASPGGTGGAGPRQPDFPPLIEGCDIPLAHQRADDALAALLVNFWSGADHSLAWLYGAGEGACVRSVLVNGQVVEPALQFPATPNWMSWTPATSNADLPAGKSTIELRFDASRGSKTSIDIDQLTVAPL